MEPLNLRALIPSLRKSVNEYLRPQAEDPRPFRHGNERSSMLDSLPSIMMAPSLPPNRARRLPRQFSLFFALFCLFGAACGTTSQNNKVLFEDSRGAVSLQKMSDGSIHATHPINLEPALLAQILTGIEVQERGDRLLQRLLSGPSSPVPVFSEEQIQFLAPLLAEGLRTASPDQHIEYRVQTEYEGSIFESSTTETTAGSLYAYGRQLFVTLSQYRSDPTRTNINVRNTNSQSVGIDYSGLKNRILLFTPRAAQRSDAFDQPEGGKPTDRFLVIDYEVLQHAPAATVTRTAPHSERAAPGRDAPTGTSASGSSAQSTETLAQEVEALKKEMQSLKQQQLGNQTPGQDSQKQKTTPQKK